MKFEGYFVIHNMAINGFAEVEFGNLVTSDEYFDKVKILDEVGLTEQALKGYKFRNLRKLKNHLNKLNANKYDKNKKCYLFEFIAYFENVDEYKDFLHKLSKLSGEYDNMIEFKMIELTE